MANLDSAGDYPAILSSALFRVLARKPPLGKCPDGVSSGEYCPPLRRVRSLFAKVLLAIWTPEGTEPQRPRFTSLAAGLGGLLFALHPVAVESVAWISEQKNTLSAVFFTLRGVGLSSRPELVARHRPFPLRGFIQDRDGHAASGAVGDDLVSAGKIVIPRRYCAAAPLVYHRDYGWAFLLPGWSARCWALPAATMI